MKELEDDGCGAEPPAQSSRVARSLDEIIEAHGSDHAACAGALREVLAAIMARAEIAAQSLDACRVEAERVNAQIAVFDRLAAKRGD